MSERREREPNKKGDLKMTMINIENKAYGELGMELTESQDMATAINLRKALVNGIGSIERVAGILADIERASTLGVNGEQGCETGEVRRALDLIVAGRHGDLLREKPVGLTIHEDGDDWVADGLLINVGGYLSVFVIGEDRVFDVLVPSDLKDSNYGMHDVADAVEQVRIFTDYDGQTEESELEDENGRAWCKFDQAWDGDNADE